MKKEIILFDNKVSIKTHSCSLNNNGFSTIEPRINLYIKLTNACPANCSFCEFHHNNSKEKFDLYKLLYIIDEIQKTVPIAKVNFTGGEPTIDPSLFIKTAKAIREKLPNSYITLNTNGYNLFTISETLGEKTIDSFALSRHHYLDEYNYKILKSYQFYSLDDLQSFSYKDKLHLRCNVINGYIDSVEKVKTYINFFSDNYNISDFGIVSLWPFNDFCEQNFIDSNKFDFTERFFLTKTQLKINKQCSCYNYLYTTPKGNIVSLYARNDKSPSDCSSILVYNVDCLKNSFDGPIIFQ